MKLRIYTATIRPIISYTLETLPDTAKTQRLFETAGMRIHRRNTGNALRDRMRNGDIRRKCENVQEINECTLIRIIEWRRPS